MRLLKNLFLTQEHSDAAKNAGGGLVDTRSAARLASSQVLPRGVPDIECNRITATIRAEHPLFRKRRYYL